MRFFRTLATRKNLFGTADRYTISQGAEAIEQIKNLIARKEYSKALDLVDETEEKYPAFFKALFFYRGEATFGFAGQMGLLQNEKTSEVVDKKQSSSEAPISKK